MELSNDQMNDIVFTVTEKVLLRMPEVMGNLIQEHTSMSKITKEFIDKNEEFQGHNLIIQKVLEQMESDNTGLPYEKLLDMAKPKIAKQILLSKNCDLTSVSTRKGLDTTIDNGRL